MRYVPAIGGRQVCEVVADRIGQCLILGIQRKGRCISGLQRTMQASRRTFKSSRLNSSLQRFHLTFCPKVLGDWQRLYVQIVPPSDFVSGSMQLMVVGTAERHRIFITDFESQRSRLSEA